MIIRHWEFDCHLGRGQKPTRKLGAAYIKEQGVNLKFAGRTAPKTTREVQKTG